MGLAEVVTVSIMGSSDSSKLLAAPRKITPTCRSPPAEILERTGIAAGNEASDHRAQPTIRVRGILFQPHAPPLAMVKAPSAANTTAAGLLKPRCETNRGDLRLISDFYGEKGTESRGERGRLLPNDRRFLADLTDK
jgi:hypothetical protein